MTLGQNVNILDANFKAYLVGNTAINTNGDAEIQLSEATSFNGTIDCSSLGISDLTGIEDFAALTYLNCARNNLDTLDVGANTALTFLNCGENQLTSLDVGANTALTELLCGKNNLDTLDVSNNLALTELLCGLNNLDTLDVSANTALTFLRCNNNNLDTLDVSNNLALTHFDCSNNNLDTLDVSANTALTTLTCTSNQLTSLDVSNNTALTYLTCTSNQLTSLDIRNGNNINFTPSPLAIGSWNIFSINGLNTTNNPNLTCISVDDPAWADTNWTVVNGNIDSTMSFSANCTPYGCTDSLACNYDSTVTIDDGSCVYADTSIDSHTACDSYTWIDGVTYTSSNNSATLVHTTAGGCDSIVYLDLTIEYSTSNIDSITACDYYTPGPGQTLTTSGIYTTISTNAVGCDHTDSLVLTINPSSFSYDTLSVNASIVWNGMTLTVSGDYSFTLTNSLDCDSIANLNLTINTTGISDIINTEKTLFKITDMLGQETPYRRNTPLFYIYDDGTVEKRIVIE